MKTFALLVWFLPVIVCAQSTRGKTIPGGRVFISTGVVSGESGNDLLGQLSVGLEKKAVFLGVGVGYDAYAYNSLPLFLDARYFVGKKCKLFLYGNGGYSVNRSNHQEGFFAETDHVKGGLYMDAGFGVRAPVRNSHVLLSVGYSRKDVERTTYYDYSSDIFTYKYRYQRMSFKIGVEL